MAPEAKIPENLLAAASFGTTVGTVPAGTAAGVLEWVVAGKWGWSLRQGALDSGARENRLRGAHESNITTSRQWPRCANRKTELPRDFIPV